MATKRKPAAKKKAVVKKNPAFVTLEASIKRGALSDAVTAAQIPADLKKGLADKRAGRIDELGLAKVASQYLAANFLSGNLPGGSALFRDAREVWANAIECINAWDAGGVLPRITAGAAFELTAGPKLPKNQDAMEDWEDEHTPLHRRRELLLEIRRTDLPHR